MLSACVARVRERDLRAPAPAPEDCTFSACLRVPWCFFTRSAHLCFSHGPLVMFALWHLEFRCQPRHTRDDQYYKYYNCSMSKSSVGPLRILSEFHWTPDPDFAETSVLRLYTHPCPTVGRASVDSVACPVPCPVRSPRVVLGPSMRSRACIVFLVSR